MTRDYDGQVITDLRCAEWLAEDHRHEMRYCYERRPVPGTLTGRRRKPQTIRPGWLILEPGGWINDSGGALGYIVQRWALDQAREIVEAAKAGAQFPGIRSNHVGHALARENSWAINGAVRLAQSMVAISYHEAAELLGIGSTS